MIVRRYVARDLPEALRQVRQDFGPEAVMLASEVVTPPRWQFWKERSVAVVAADAMPGAADKGKESAELLKAVADLGRQVAQLSKKLEEAKAAAAPPVALSGAAGEPPPIAAQLAAAGLAASTALAVAAAREGRSLRPAEAALAEGSLAAWLEARRDPQPWAPRTVALVGPTGAGKTTTLAKMAAQAALERGEQVALISLDTYRVAALDQLRTYAEILSVPFRVAYDGEDLARAVEEQAAADRVFIDTPGRNFKSPVAVAELMALLRRGAPDSVDLVVPASMAPAAAEELARAFGRVEASRLVISKWDEHPRPDPFLPCLLALDRPWAFFANGQVVPEDLVQPSSVGLARALLGLDAPAA